MKKVLLHLPHSSIHIPENELYIFNLSKKEIEEEIEKITDLYIDKLFIDGKEDFVNFNYNRLLCDVERFEDNLEEMSKIGMGIVYEMTSDGKVLKNNITENYKNKIKDLYYRPHHKLLEDEVNLRLNKYNECIIIDCHSFNPKAAYLDKQDFPDICIGTDDYHTPDMLLKKVKNIVELNDYKVFLNSPFAGSITPLKYYKKDKRVKSIMVEINRDIYNNSQSDFEKVKEVCKEIYEKLIKD